jgi:hypothetical protein
MIERCENKENREIKGTNSTQASGATHFWFQGH